MEEQTENNYQPSYSDSELTDSFLKVMIDIEDTMQKFEMESLRRKRLVADLKLKTKKWVPIATGINPICNELGISELLGFMRGRATVISRLTRKTTEEIYKDMFQFDMALTEMITLRADDWNLDEELAKPLKEECLAIVQDIIFSSLNGFTAVNLRSQYSRHENSNSSTENENNGGHSILGLKFGKK